MSKIKVSLQNGEIRYEGKIDAVPASSKTTGNVTINNSAQPGFPSHYATNIYVSVSTEDAGITTPMGLSIQGVVLSDDHRAPYRDIEDQAARKIAPLLRAIADEVDKIMVEFDARQAEKATS